jgi:hypothetical protein
MWFKNLNVVKSDLTAPTSSRLNQAFFMRLRQISIPFNDYRTSMRFKNLVEVKLDLKPAPLANI